jgi:hypothetical protein
MRNYTESRKTAYSIPGEVTRFLIDLILAAILWSFDEPSLEQKYVPGVILADNLTAICEPTV